MATIKAILRKRQDKYQVNENGDSIIYIQYGHQAKTALFSTGVKINPEYWNEKKQIVDSKKTIKKAVTNESLIRELEKTDNITNALIKSQKAKIEGIVRKLQYEEKTPTIYI